MRHEITTLNTKKALAESLKKFMKKKPLSKVTVSEIIADCNVNRKTFYYHFENIYALLKWMFEQEAIEVVKEFDLFIDYRDAIIFIMDYIDNNKHILNCVFDSMGRDELKIFFYNDFIGIMNSLVDRVEKEMNLSVSVDFKNFVSNLYTEALAGNLIDWIRNKNEHENDREKTLNYIYITFRASLPAVLSAAPTDN